MRTLLAAGLVALLGGCNTEQMLAERCASYGAAPGAPGFAECVRVEREDARREAEAFSLRATRAITGAAMIHQMMQPQQSPYLPPGAYRPGVTCTPLGNFVQCW